MANRQTPTNPFPQQTQTATATNDDAATQAEEATQNPAATTEPPAPAPVPPQAPKAAPAPSPADPRACKNCGQIAKYPNWKCSGAPGNHKIEAKEYYDLAGSTVHPKTNRRAFAPSYVLRAERDYFDQAQQRTIPGGHLQVKFAMGRYRTDDAEEIFYLDKIPNLKTGAEGLSAWTSIYLTEEQQKAKATEELERVHRELREANSALEKARQQAAR